MMQLRWIAGLLVCVSAVALLATGCRDDSAASVQAAASGKSLGSSNSNASSESQPESLASNPQASSTPKPPKPISKSNLPQRDISFDDLEFDIERDAEFERSMLTPEIEALDNAKVKIYGFILSGSVFKQEFERFVLIRDNQQCCFGPGAYIYHNMQVEMEPGRTAKFSVRPVAVEGELHIRPWHGPDGKCYSIFHLTASKVSQ